MKLHRFFVEGMELGHDFWLHDEKLLHEWNDVLRLKPGQEVVLFDGRKHDRLYKIDELTKDEAHLLLITDFEQKLPKRNIYLLWPLLEKDDNDRVLQQGTQLGISHFLPFLADHSEETKFDREQAEIVVRQTTEQSGRSDVPTVREPMHLAKAIEQLKGKAELYLCSQEGEDVDAVEAEDIGIVLSPKGGWSGAEQKLLDGTKLRYLNVGPAVEPEAVAAKVAEKLLQ